MTTVLAGLKDQRDAGPAKQLDAEGAASLHPPHVDLWWREPEGDVPHEALASKSTHAYAWRWAVRAFLFLETCCRLPAPLCARIPYPNTN